VRVFMIWIESPISDRLTCVLGQMRKHSPGASLSGLFFKTFQHDEELQYFRKRSGIMAERGSSRLHPSQMRW